VQAVLTILGDWRQRVGEDAKWRDLHGADYRGANLAKAQLPYSYFYDAQLQGAKLKRANLEHADLSRAQLQGADLRDAKLEGANLSDANLQDVIADEHTEWPKYWRDPALRRHANIKEIPHDYPHNYRPDTFNDSSSTTPTLSPRLRYLRFVQYWRESYASSLSYFQRRLMHAWPSRRPMYIFGLTQASNRKSYQCPSRPDSA
jgi:uncharacterized protein YjbI with pentapeptide repeats